MMKSYPQRHCTDEQLLAHADGELRRLAGLWVARHLKSCWECRRRLGELEAEVGKVASDLQVSGDWRDRSEKARRRFQAWVTEYERERERQRVPLFHLNSGGAFSRRALGAASLGLLLALFAWWIWRQPGTSRPEPRRVLEQASQYEVMVYRQSLPVHHSYRVEIVQTEPRKRQTRSRLEVWSNPNEGRYAVRWLDEHGELRRALWRPTDEEEYTYDAERRAAVQSASGTRSQKVSWIDLPRFGLEAEQLESGFMHWIASQRWQPVSLARGMTAFCSAQGTVMEAEPIGEEGTTLLRLTAFRQSGSVRIEVEMHVDADSYRPRFQAIRCESRGRMVEIRLYPVSSEPTRFLKASRSVFEPDVPIARHLELARELDRRSVEGARVHQKLHEGPSISEESWALAEVRVERALHERRACLGDPLEIKRQSGGNLLVQGTVSSESRKKELLAVLQPLPGVNSQIMTIAEAIAHQSPEGAPSGLNPSEDSAQEVRAGRIPMQEVLEEYFRNLDRNTDGGDDRKDISRVHARITALSNRAISLATSTRQQGFALRHLVERFPESKLRLMSEEGQETLINLLREHLAELESLAKEYRLLLEPVLSSSAYSEFNPEMIEGRSEAPLQGKDLPQLVLQLASLCQETTRLTFALFGGAGPRLESPREALHSLIGKLCLVQRGAESLESSAPLRVVNLAPSR
ncbi:MAG: hypothetical protein AB1898_16065 [Acidobacteriota bacterium]